MRTETRDRVDAYWCAYFSLPPERLHVPGASVTASDDGWPGIVVAGDPRSAHVRCPVGLEGAVGAAVAALEPADLWRVDTWLKVPGLSVASVHGPSVHAYADDVAALPPVDPRVHEVPVGDLATLADEVTRDEWSEAGFADEVSRAFALIDEGHVVAAANLTQFDGRAADVGLLTRADARGRGLATAVAAVAVQAAVVAHGVARWRSRESNTASRAVGRRLGFEDYGANLAVCLNLAGA